MESTVILKELRLTNWKSFANATLYIDPLTFIIGTNASGKSNILDALDFLNRSACGTPIVEAAKTIRGGVDWIFKQGTYDFELSILMSVDEADITYTISCRKIDQSIEIYKESLIHKKSHQKDKTLFTTNSKAEISGSPIIATTFYTEKRGPGKNIDINRRLTVLSQIDSISTCKLVRDISNIICKKLRSFFILNPIPNNMRGFSILSEKLNQDASNIAGVLAGMDFERQQKIQKDLTQYVRTLPEKDINAIWAEKVGRFESDAMLYCEEQWVNGKKQEMDARGMSDGTLRFAAIALALLTGNRGSLLVIEEIDNGLHPSRAKELVQMLLNLGEKMSIDIICTTHNPVLIDALGPTMLPFISYVTRNENDGNSEIRLLEDKDNITKLMAKYSAGELMVNDVL